MNNIIQRRVQCDIIFTILFFFYALYPFTSFTVKTFLRIVVIDFSL
jgi:hypothetical protein